MKKFFSFCLLFCMIFSFNVVVFAAEPEYSHNPVVQQLEESSEPRNMIHLGCASGNCDGLGIIENSTYDFFTQTVIHHVVCQKCGFYWQIHMSGYCK